MDNFETNIQHVEGVLENRTSRKKLVLYNFRKNKKKLVDDLHRSARYDREHHIFKPLLNFEEFLISTLQAEQHGLDDVLFPQLIVLVVSYFESGIRELFREDIESATAQRKFKRLTRYDNKLKFEFSDFMANADDSESCFANAFATKIIKGMALYNLREIENILGRLHKKEQIKQKLKDCGVDDVCRDTVQHVIEMRHVIVHNGSDFTDPLYNSRDKQFSNSTLLSCVSGDKLSLTEDNIKDLVSKFRVYYNFVRTSLERGD